jgi:polar amino acid transport system substrate-binding protein
MNKAVVKLLYFASIILALRPHYSMASELLILRGNENYPPDEMHVDGVLTGFHIELIQNAAQLIPLTIKFESIPWRRAIQMLKNGEGDALSYVSKNPEREKYAFFLDDNILTESHYHLLINSQRKEEIHYSGAIKDLAKYTVGIQRGYAYSEEFDQTDAINKVVINSVKQMTSLIKANRIDLAILTREEYLAQQANTDFKNISILSPALASNASYLAFSKANTKNIFISKLFAKAMKKYKASEDFQLLKNKYNK